MGNIYHVGITQRPLHNLFILYNKGRLARFTWLLLLFLWAANARPQLLRRLNSISYNVNEGLLQSHVADIIEDGNGFIWLSTGSGVQRFDGKRFHQVQAGTAGRVLPDDKYVHFFRLANGNLWITHSKGINEYDIYTNSFKTIYEFKNLGAGHAANNQLYAVLETPQAVWCVTPRGLVAISKQTKQVDDAIPFAPMTGLSLVSPLSPTQNFFLAAGKSICVFLAPGEIRVVNTVTRKINSITATADQRFFYAIEKLTDDTLAVASARGIEKMSIADGRFLGVYPYIIPPEKSHQRFPIHLCLVKKNGLLVSFTNELYEMDTRTGRYTSHLVNPQNQSFLNNGYVNGCLADRFHNLWLVTVSDGIKKINYNFSGFRYFGMPDPKNNFVKSVYVDKSANQVFSGTFNSGLYIFDTAQQLIRHINAFPGAQPPYPVCAVEKAGPHEYLVLLTGAWDAYALNTQTFTLRKLPIHRNTQSTTDKLDYYLTLMKTGDSAVYLSTFFGLYRMGYSASGLQLHLLDTTPIPAICAYTDHSKRVWIGSSGYYYLFTNDSTPLRSFSLPGKILCRCFLNDRSGRLWLGTEKGLYRLSREGEVLSALHTSDGLPDDCIYAIREDHKGNIWFSHNKGITCMSRSGSMLHFSKNDGLQENEFNTNTSFETADGELYFGGVNGISGFYPDVVSNITETPSVLLSGIKVNDEYWKEDTAYWRLQQLQLPYYNNIVSFEFTALGQRNPDQYIYQYQVTGMDPDWINAGIHPDPRYVLSPGKYIFRYYAGNSFDRHPLHYKELLIIVRPPFWNSWWFITLAAIAIAALLFFIVLLYNKRAKARLNSELETKMKIQQERDRISRELHDNIGSQLSFISSSIDWITEPPGPLSKEEELKRLSNINDTAKLVISDLRETIWALKKESIPLDEMADRLKLFIRMQRTLQPQMEMGITENITNNISFSPTEALNIFRICQEAIVNSIKHSGATRLNVTIQSGPGKAYAITIEDNGRGFAGEPKGEEHYGLENMQHRAKELGAVLQIRSGEGKGATLVLRNIVEN